jgi:hypothetical protein
MYIDKLQTIVETTEFIRQAESCMEESSKDEFIVFIASNPLKGELITNTGGARKVRWASSSHQGKRGGVRIIYYYHDEVLQFSYFLSIVKSKGPI